MNSQFIEQWNEAFHFKLRESDLQQPTELVLFGALSCYLQHININVPKIREELLVNEQNQLEFRSEFCAYIDRLYKYSLPQEHFLYFDLIHPSPKKTCYLLKHLLNFYHFHKVVQDEIVQHSVNLIDEYERATAEKNKCQRENQMNQDKLAEIEKQLDYLSGQIPDLKKSVNTLKKSNGSIEDQINTNQTKLTDSKLKSIAVQQQIEEEQDALVTAEQQESIQRILEQLDKELEELEEIEECTLAGNREIVERLEAADENMNSLNKFYENCVISDITTAFPLQMEVTQLKHDTTAGIKARNQLQRQIDLEREKYRNFETLCAEQIAKLSEDETAFAPKISKMKREHSELFKNQQILESKLRDLDTIVETLKMQQECIERESKNVLDTISASSSTFNV